MCSGKAKTGLKRGFQSLKSRNKIKPWTLSDRGFLKSIGFVYSKIVDMRNLTLDSGFGETKTFPYSETVSRRLGDLKEDRDAKLELIKHGSVTKEDQSFDTQPNLTIDLAVSLESISKVRSRGYFWL